MSVDGNPISVQSIIAYDDGVLASDATYDLTYYDKGAFRVLTWWTAEYLTDKEGILVGHAGWGDGDFVMSDVTFKPGEMFLIQPYCGGTPSLNISGSVKQYSSDLALAPVLYDNDTKTATGCPFPTACGVQEIKAFDDEKEATDATFDLTYYDKGAFRVLTWWTAEYLTDKEGILVGHAGWGDGDFVISDKEFTASEGFLLQPYCGGQPSLGFVNPFYKGDK